MTFAAAMIDYFGKLPGQSLSDFGKELRALTPEDREFFKAELRKLGKEIEEPKTT